MRVQSLGWEDPLEKEMATHSSSLAWEIPWTEEPDGLQSMGLQKIRIQLSNQTTTIPHPNITSIWEGLKVEGSPLLFSMQLTTSRAMLRKSWSQNNSAFSC